MPCRAEEVQPLVALDLYALVFGRRRIDISEAWISWTKDDSLDGINELLIEVAG